MTKVPSRTIEASTEIKRDVMRVAYDYWMKLPEKTINDLREYAGFSFGDFNFAYFRSTRLFGLWASRTKTIYLNLPLIESAEYRDEMLHDTLPHELAHALQDCLLVVNRTKRGMPIRREISHGAGWAHACVMLTGKVLSAKGPTITAESVGMKARKLRWRGLKDANGLIQYYKIRGDKMQTGCTLFCRDGIRRTTTDNVVMSADIPAPHQAGECPHIIEADLTVGVKRSRYQAVFAIDKTMIFFVKSRRSKRYRLKVGTVGTQREFGRVMVLDHSVLSVGDPATIDCPDEIAKILSEAA